MDKESTTNANINVVCFGEVLWDNLPTGKKPGGAPMNVAYHLNKLAVKGNLISRIGNDLDGRRLLQVLEEFNISTNYCQIDTLNKTSTVEVSFNENNEVEYEIVYPVAWDFIALETELISLVTNANAFVFGSLASRNEISKNTLVQLLQVAKYRVFDVNLRAPYFNREDIGILLENTDLLKLNVSELEIIAQWYMPQLATTEKQIEFLQEQFGVQEIVLTKGSFGASYFSKNLTFHQPAHAIIVNDTVGSGDSFLAGFLAKKLLSMEIEKCMGFAAALSALVTMHEGACPSYDKQDVLNLLA